MTVLSITRIVGIVCMIAVGVLLVAVAVINRQLRRNEVDDPAERLERSAW